MPAYFRSPHSTRVAGSATDSSTAPANPHQAAASSSAARARPATAPRRRATSERLDGQQHPAHHEQPRENLRHPTT